MSAVAVLSGGPVATFIDMPLEQSLEYLSRYGCPSLSRHDSGWHCRINVFISGDGVEFMVQTDFKSRTPKIAASLCCDRLSAALKGLAK